MKQRTTNLNVAMPEPLYAETMKQARLQNKTLSAFVRETLEKKVRAKK